MTLGDIIAKFANSSPIQFVHECVVGAREVNPKGSRGSKKGHERYTRLEITTQQMSTDDVFWWTQGGGEARKPKYVGIIVWIPRDDYDAAIKADQDELAAAVRAGGVPPDIKK